MDDKRRKHHVFTMNNPTITREQLISQFEEIGFTYIVIGDEVGQSGTPHYQGYVELKDVKRFSTLRKLFPGIHFAARRGTPEQASNYCKKDGNFVEQGTLSILPHEAGGRKRKAQWQDVQDLAKQRKFGDIAEKYPDIAIMYGNGVRKLSSFVNQPEVPRKVETQVYWFYGAPGTGKTHRAREMAPNAYLKSIDKWWDGYNYEEDVHIEELSLVDTATASLIKQWTDVWDFKAEIKGSFIGRIRPKRVFITSNYPITEVFNSTDAPAIERRCVQILKFISFDNIITVKDGLQENQALSQVSISPQEAGEEGYDSSQIVPQEGIV